MHACKSMITWWGKDTEKIPGCYCWALKEWKGARGEEGKKNNFIVKYVIIYNIINNLCFCKNVDVEYAYYKAGIWLYVETCYANMKL